MLGGDINLGECDDELRLESEVFLKIALDALLRSGAFFALALSAASE